MSPRLAIHVSCLAVGLEYPDPWLDCTRGAIDTKTPDEEILAKMLQIAAALNGKVQMARFIAVRTLATTMTKTSFGMLNRAHAPV